MLHRNTLHIWMSFTDQYFIVDFRILIFHKCLWCPLLEASHASILCYLYALKCTFEHIIYGLLASPYKTHWSCENATGVVGQVPLSTLQLALLMWNNLRKVGWFDKKVVKVAALLLPTLTESVSMGRMFESIYLFQCLSVGLFVWSSSYYWHHH